MPVVTVEGLESGSNQDFSCSVPPVTVFWVATESGRSLPSSSLEGVSEASVVLAGGPGDTLGGGVENVFESNPRDPKLKSSKSEPDPKSRSSLSVGGARMEEDDVTGGLFSSWGSWAA